MKSMKKLMLAGLVLLASVMVLVGCKMEAEPEVKVPPKLESISVSPPNKTVYSVGEGFDTTGMVVTASYDDGTKKTVEGIITPASSEITKTKGLNKCITVSYTEGGTETEASFSIDVVDPETPTKLESYISPNDTDNTWSYVAFGEWPQSEAKNVTPSLVTPQPEGLFKGNYYSDSNGKYVKQGDKYFKVEPIVWRVLTEAYDSTENALLLAEKILIAGIPFYSAWNYNRNIDGATIDPNNYEHSEIRAYLNGGEYEYMDSSTTVQIKKSAYKNKGFFQTAFATNAQSQIKDTILGKIFLLSHEEVCKKDFGFGSMYDYMDSRKRFGTDYAKACGGQYLDTSWLLRTPNSHGTSWVDAIAWNGQAMGQASVSNTSKGYVPALCVSASAIK